MTAAAVSALLPVIVVVPAVLLALTCKCHPVLGTVILPEGDLQQKPEIPAKDINSRRNLLLVVLIALVIAAGMTLVLWAQTHPESFTWLNSLAKQLEPIAQAITPNLAVLLLGVVMTLFPLPMMLRTFTWFTPWRGVVCVVFVTLVLFLWVSIDSWLTINLITGVSAIIAVLLFQTSMSFMRLSTIFMILAVVYDARMVYGTRDMITAAQESLPLLNQPERVLEMPALFILPGELTLNPATYGFLGAGDVFVLGLMAVTAARFGKMVGSIKPLLMVLAGFIVSMYLCSWVGWYFQFPQPATIFIVPCCALPVIIFAKRRGYMTQLTTPVYTAPSLLELLKSTWRKLIAARKANRSASSEE